MSDLIEKWREEHPDEALAYEKDGQLILDDPVGIAIARAVAKHNCGNTFRLNAERIAHFKRRSIELGKTATQVVIAILNADDIHGGPLADALMPGYNWQEIRDRGEIPFARGLAMRDGIRDAVGIFDADAAEKLRNMTGLAVVVVDHQVAEIFPVEGPTP